MTDSWRTFIRQTLWFVTVTGDRRTEESIKKCRHCGPRIPPKWYWVRPEIIVFYRVKVYHEYFKPFLYRIKTVMAEKNLCVPIRNWDYYHTPLFMKFETCFIPVWESINLWWQNIQERYGLIYSSGFLTKMVSLRSLAQILTVLHPTNQIHSFAIIS